MWPWEGQGPILSMVLALHPQVTLLQVLPQSMCICRGLPRLEDRGWAKGTPPQAWVDPLPWGQGSLGVIWAVPFQPQALRLGPLQDAHRPLQTFR